MAVFVLKCFEAQTLDKIKRGYLLFPTEALADNYLSYAKSDIKRQQTIQGFEGLYEKMGMHDVGDFLQKQVDHKRTFFTGAIPGLIENSL